MTAVLPPWETVAWETGCWKTSYGSHAAARKAMTGAHADSRRRSRDFRAVRSYDCPDCGAIHITSQPRKDRAR